MEPVEGVKLSDELKTALEEHKNEQVRSVRNKIKGILGEFSKARGTVTRLKIDLAKAEAAQKKWEDRLSQLQNDNWKILSGEGSKPEESDDGVHEVSGA